MKISVAMCTYNGVRHLGEQLASIAGQTRPPDELVVCDDCSGDATAGIVREFAAAASFPVRLYVNDRNLGSTRNFEQAIGRCGGDLIALADQDDVWRRDKLAQIERLFASPDRPGLVFSDAEVVGPDLRPLGHRVWEGVNIRFGARERRRCEAGRAFEVLLAREVVTGATMAFRAEFRDLVLPIPDGIKRIHDGWISLAISAAAPVAFIAEPLIEYRQHPAQQMSVELPGQEPGLLAEIRDGVGGEEARALRRNYYRREIHELEVLRERLRERVGDFPCAGALPKIEAKLAHLRARAEMPGARLGRLPRVMRELATRRYHLFSRGLVSAAKDLLA